MPISWSNSSVLNSSGSSRIIFLYLPVGCLPLRMCDLLHASRGSFTKHRLTESALLNKPLSSSLFPNVTLFFLLTFLCYFFFFFYSLESKKPEDFDRLFSLKIVFVSPFRRNGSLVPHRQFDLLWFTILDAGKTSGKRQKSTLDGLASLRRRRSRPWRKEVKKAKRIWIFLLLGFLEYLGVSVDDQCFRLWDEQSGVLGTTCETKCFFFFFLPLAGYDQ